MIIVSRFIHSLLIPKESNNFRAKALHVSTLTAYLIGALLLTIFIKNMQSRSSDILGYATDITTRKLYDLTNQQRAKHNLESLSYNEKLADAAYRKAQDMFQKNYWSHYAQDGTTPWNFITTAGYDYEYAGENLAKNFMFSQGVIEAWMNSPTHRENILKPQYREIGLAVVNGLLNGEQTTLVVQMFGKPQTSLALPKPSSQNVLARESKRPLINLMPITFNMNLLFMVFLIFAFAIDFYIASRSSAVRIGGKNIAHILFIAFVFIGLLILRKGSTL